MKSKHLKLQSYIYSGCAVVFVHILIWIFQSNRNRNTWQKHTSNTGNPGRTWGEPWVKKSTFYNFQIKCIIYLEGKT